MTKYNLKAASEAARFNRDILEKDSKCACYSCMKVFSPKEIKEWCAEEQYGEEVTAICPYCNIDAVIAEASGYSLTKEFLMAMNRMAFG